MGSIIVRNIDEQTRAQFKREVEARGVSVNRLMHKFIRSGLRARKTQTAKGRYHDLDSLAGTWTARDEREFFALIRPLVEIDEKLWQ